MAITVNNLQSASTDTLAYTPSSVTDSCLVVIISSEDVSPLTPITGVSFGVTPMILEVVGNGVLGANSNDVAMAYLVNPGTSSQTITVTGGQHDRLGIAALTLDNVDQSSAIDVSNGSFENTSVSVVSTTETTNNNNSFVVSGGVTGDNTASLSVTGGVEILEFSPPSTRMAVATSAQVVAGVYTHTWTSTIAGRTAAASIAFNLASGSGVTVTAESGTYLYIGSSVDLIRAKILTAESGSYNYTGTSVNLLKGFVLTANTGSYSYLGQDATLTYTPAGAFILTAGTGNYTYIGTDINFNRDRVIIMSSGTYNYTGTDIQIILPGQIWTDKPSASTNWNNQTNVTTIWTDK